ncbi:MAG: hypothetical protein AAFX40_14905, partial [Cyanobacteria bacterium J06639_1]
KTAKPSHSKILVPLRSPLPTQSSCEVIPLVIAAFPIYRVRGADSTVWRFCFRALNGSRAQGAKNHDTSSGSGDRAG